MKQKDIKINDLEKEINKVHSSLTGNAGRLEKELHNLKINVIPKKDDNISMLNNELKDKYEIIDELNYSLDSLKKNKSELSDL
jgi:predicted RNase H-like nuclease (RuvC/YqgF family)